MLARSLLPLLCALSGALNFTALRAAEPPLRHQPVALPEGVRTVRDLAYSQAGGRELALDLYLPPGEAGARVSGANPCAWEVAGFETAENSSWWMGIVQSAIRRLRRMPTSQSGSDTPSGCLVGRGDRGCVLRKLEACQPCVRGFTSTRCAAPREATSPAQPPTPSPT